jgi:hypothetical protein
MTPADYVQGALSQGIKRPARVADLSPPSSAQGTNDTRSNPRSYKDKLQTTPRFPAVSHRPVPHTASQQRTAQINGGGTCYTAPLSPHIAQISVRTYYCHRPPGGKHYGQGVTEAEVKGRHRRQSQLLPS